MKLRSLILTFGVFFTCFCILCLTKAETVAWLENFDYGNANNRWAFDGTGTWQIGSPTFGPPTNASGFRTYSGTNCATTSLSASYPANQDSRLIQNNSFPVPASNQFPRLRFWHYYSIGGGDHAWVEIKPAGSNTWTAISPDYGDTNNLNIIRNGGNIWSRPSLDLSAFAGQTVQIAFHFTSNSGGAVAPNAGWFVDDVALVTNMPTFNKTEDFESGMGDWAVEKGTWEIGSPVTGPPTNALGYRAFTGTNCAGFVMSGSNYQANIDSRFISPQVMVPATNQFPRLRFWQYYSIGGGDHAWVEIKPAGSNTWTAISPDYGDVGNASHTPSTGGLWTRPSLDLSSYAGQMVQIAFHFTSDSGGAVAPNAGWFVDGVTIVTGVPVFNNPEGWEGGIGDWYADTGVWQVGQPSKAGGPSTNAVGSQAHSGTNCAATFLRANYPLGANSRLISPPFIVPATNQFPRLRFWQWYAFFQPSGPDYGVVEVKGTNGIWQAVSPEYTGSGGAWTYSSIDLSSYAGQTLQIAFHLIWVNNNPTSPGWYIDDIALETGAPVFNNPEGWTNGIGDWYAEQGTWQVGQPTKAGGPATNSVGSQAHSGTNCAATLLNSNYPVGANSRLISPPFVVPRASSNPYFRFWHWFSFIGPDYGVVEIRVGTNAWQAISSQFTGTAARWLQSAQIDLSSYADQTVQLAFHLVWVNNNPTAPGWYIDELGLFSSGIPVFNTIPANQTQAVGTTATLNVSVSGDLPLSYQWRFNSNSISGATNAYLTLTNLQLQESGYYDVVVTNDAGSATNTPAALLQVVIDFTGIDMGTPGAAGSFTNSNDTWIVSGSGEGTDGSADVMYFASQPLSGDAQIMARLKSLHGGDPRLAETGVMIRETLDPGSKEASFTMNASTNLLFRRRLSTNSIGNHTSLSATNYFQGTNSIWMRLMRIGNTFVAHYSTNGINWQYMWFTTVAMSNQVQVGLAVTAHSYGELATATFDNVSIGSLTPLPGAWPLPVPELLLGGEAWSPSELQRVGGYAFLIGGTDGDYFSINGSTDISLPLASWPSLGIVTNTYGVAPFQDNQVFTNEMRFYRAQRLGP